MFGSRILEVAIGIIFIFLLVSMICSAIREGIESWVKSRAAFLEQGIRELLHDRHAVGIARSLYTHPLVYGLYATEYRPRTSARPLTALARGGNLPSYIPSRIFALALLDIAAHGTDTRGAASGPAAPAFSLALARENVLNLENGAGAARRARRDRPGARRHGGGDRQHRRLVRQRDGSRLGRLQARDAEAAARDRAHGGGRAQREHRRHRAPSLPRRRRARTLVAHAEAVARDSSFIREAHRRNSRERAPRSIRCGCRSAGTTCGSTPPWDTRVVRDPSGAVRTVRELRLWAYVLRAARRLDARRARRDARRALLVRPAQQGDDRSLHREAAREESGGIVGGPADRARSGGTGRPRWSSPSRGAGFAPDRRRSIVEPDRDPRRRGKTRATSRPTQGRSSPRTRSCPPRREASPDVSPRLTWLPDVLRGAGLKVSLVPGWESRGGDAPRPDPRRHLPLHGDARDASRNMPTLDLLIRGREDLPGPLCQLGLGRDGTYLRRRVRAGESRGTRRVERDHDRQHELHRHRGGELRPCERSVARGAARRLSSRRRGDPSRDRTHGGVVLRSSRVRPPERPQERRESRDGSVSPARRGDPRRIDPPILIPAAETGGRSRPTLRRGDSGQFVTELQQRLGLSDGATRLRSEDGGAGARVPARAEHGSRWHRRPQDVGGDRRDARRMSAAMRDRRAHVDSVSAHVAVPRTSTSLPQAVA